MITLTRQQKISNVKELIESKTKKKLNLEREIKQLEQKLHKLNCVENIQEEKLPHWNTKFTDEDLVPPSIRNQFTGFTK